MEKSRKELISEKRKLTNRLKDYSNPNDYCCMAAELIVKRILKINSML
jgi:hypothetical protein